MSSVTDYILEVRNLRTYFNLTEGTLKAVDGVDLNIAPHQTVGVIGESGSGKSVTAQSILQIVPTPGSIESGEILLRQTDGTVVDICRLDPRSREIRAIRGAEISMVFQEPMTSLSPVHTIGAQIIEAIQLHIERDKKKAKELALDMINRVGISNPDQRFDEYPSSAVRRHASACDDRDGPVLQSFPTDR